MSSCMYCGKKIDLLVSVKENIGICERTYDCCSEKCAEKLTLFLRFFKRYKRPFIIMFCVSMAMLIAGSLILGLGMKLVGGILFCSAVVLIGLEYVLFPFATPLTNELLGVKKAVVITRFLGAATLALAVFIGWQLWKA